MSEDSEPTTVLAPVSRGWRSERTRTTTPNFSARLEGKGLLQNGYLKYRRKKKKAGGGEKGAQSESRLLRQPRPGALRNRTTPRHGRPDAARRLCPELRARPEPSGPARNPGHAAAGAGRGSPHLGEAARRHGRQRRTGAPRSGVSAAGLTRTAQSSAAAPSTAARSSAFLLSSGSVTPPRSARLLPPPPV